MCGYVRGQFVLRMAVMMLLFSGSVILAKDVAIDQVDYAPDARVEVPEPSDKAVAFHRGNQWIWFVSECISIAVPLLILMSPLSVRLEKLSWSIGSGRVRAVVLFVAMVLTISFLVRLPWRYVAGHIRMKAYGLSNQTGGEWFVEGLKSLAVLIVIQALVAGVVWGVLVVKSPRYWWLWTAAGTMPFLVLGVFLMPLIIDPLFNKFGPLKNEKLKAEILAMAETAGVSDADVFEVDKSRQTKAVNAYVTGLLGSKRVVMWDTLLSALPEREVKAVVAHELGHYVLGHVKLGVLLGGISAFGGMWLLNFCAQRIINHSGGLLNVSDIQSLRAMLLVAVLASSGELLFSPVSNMISRYMEHEADRFAIELTRDPASVANAFSSLQKENLSVPFPGWFYRTWRATHPSIGERIEFANAYRPWKSGDRMKYSAYFQRQIHQDMKTEP